MELVRSEDSDSSQTTQQNIENYSKCRRRVVIVIFTIFGLVLVSVGILFSGNSTKVGFISIGVVAVIVLTSSYFILRYYNTHVVGSKMNNNRRNPGMGLIGLRYPEDMSLLPSSMDNHQPHIGHMSAIQRYTGPQTMPIMGPPIDVPNIVNNTYRAPDNVLAHQHGYIVVENSDWVEPPSYESVTTDQNCVHGNQPAPSHPPSYEFVMSCDNNVVK